MDRNFGGVVWTNHALEKLRQRGIKQGDAWATFRRPEQSRHATAKGAWVYYRTFGNQKIEVVAKQNEQKEWVILSVWSRPVYTKSSSAYEKKAPSAPREHPVDRALEFLLGRFKKAR